MIRIAHLSDLHFGTEIPAVATALAAELATLQPALVIVSGDLTQRARCRQFAAARAYLAQLPQPQLIVPGNHDVPLFDVVRRFLRPLERYRRYINPELNPLFVSPDLFVIGLNTARSFAWKSGRISIEQIDGLQSRLRAAGDRMKIVVTHHPFIPPPQCAGITLVGRAARAIPILDQGRVDLLLAGHLHQGYAGNIQAQYPMAQRSVIAAQAGTAISRRTRQERNAYNWITLDRSRITITVRAWQETGFTSLRMTTFASTPRGWIEFPGSPPGPVRA